MNGHPARRLHPASRALFSALVVPLPLLGALLYGAPLPPVCAALYLIGDSTARADIMTNETVYMGRRLRLSATHNADGSWTGTAEFLDQPQPAVTAEGFASQAEALEAALSRAMAKIDVERRFQGKP